KIESAGESRGFLVSGVQRNLAKVEVTPVHKEKGTSCALKINGAGVSRGLVIFVSLLSEFVYPLPNAL
ncbi:hypothetical protein SAMN04488136_1611, partial [Vibrio xiamenensis]